METNGDSETKDTSEPIGRMLLVKVEVLCTKNHKRELNAYLKKIQILPKIQ